MPADVFISHASEDKSVVDSVSAGLESAGISCWVSYRDVPAGADYRDSIVDAIETSRIFLLIYSSYSIESAHVLREVTLAAEVNKTIIPFRIEDAQESKALRYYLTGRNWLAASNPLVDSDIDSLVDAIGRVENAQQGSRATGEKPTNKALMAKEDAPKGSSITRGFRIPYDIRFVSVGAPGVGKTLLRIQTYRMLRHVLTGLYLKPHQNDDNDVILLHAQNASRGIQPPPTQASNTFSAGVFYYGHEVATCSWTDCPGEVFVNWFSNDAFWRQEREKFLKSTVTVNGLFLVIQAQMFNSVRSLEESDRGLHAAITAFLENRARAGADCTAAIAIVITCSRRNAVDLASARKVAGNLKNYANACGRQIGIKSSRFHCKAFEVDSIANAQTEGNRPPPGQDLVAWRVGRPFYWLLGKAIRNCLDTTDLPRPPLYLKKTTATKAMAAAESMSNRAP